MKAASALTGSDPSAPPKLVRHLNLGTFWNLPNWSLAGGKTHEERIEIARAAGIVGIQDAFAEQLPETDIPIIGMGRVDKVGDAEALAMRHRDQGFHATTLHVGNGLETDLEMDALVASILEASARHDYPLYVETHRATVTQDLRRTVDLVSRFPDLRFNADLSHWYTGSEMTYGDINRRFDFLEPVFERVRYLHGRIGNSCCAQVAVTSDETSPHVEHFREMWTRCFVGFLGSAQPGEVVAFAPELLPTSITVGSRTHWLNYARQVVVNNGEPKEETDRWQQSLVLYEIAEQCFSEAQCCLKAV
jgi:hypothetical protein